MRIENPLTEISLFVDSVRTKARYDMMLGISRIAMYAAGLFSAIGAVAAVPFWGVPIALGAVGAAVLFHELYQAVRDEQDNCTTLSGNFLILGYFLK